MDVRTKFLAALDAPWMKLSSFLPGVVNKREFRVFAMRRSGQHAVVNWIFAQSPFRYCLLNNCKPTGNPYKYCKRLDSIVGNKLFEHQYLDWKNELKGQHAKKGVLLYNYEDVGLTELAEDFEARRAEWLGKSEVTREIIILRDPFNLFASRYRWALGQKHAPKLDTFPESVEKWKEHARTVINWHNSYDDRNVPILYNNWFTDEAYRNSLSKKLKIKQGNKGLSKVAMWGPTSWGDSFDGDKFDGKAEQMKVLERWKQYKKDQFFTDLFDSEVLELSSNLFPHETESFKDSN